MSFSARGQRAADCERLAACSAVRGGSAVTCRRLDRSADSTTTSAVDSPSCSSCGATGPLFPAPVSALIVRAELAPPIGQLVANSARTSVQQMNTSPKAGRRLAGRRGPVTRIDWPNIDPVSRSSDRKALVLDFRRPQVIVLDVDPTVKRLGSFGRFRYLRTGPSNGLAATCTGASCSFRVLIVWTFESGPLNPTITLSTS